MFVFQSALGRKRGRALLRRCTAVRAIKNLRGVKARCRCEVLPHTQPPFSSSASARRAAKVGIGVFVTTPSVRAPSSSASGSARRRQQFRRQKPWSSKVGTIARRAVLEETGLVLRTPRCATVLNVVGRHRLPLRGHLHGGRVRRRPPATAQPRARERGLGLVLVGRKIADATLRPARARAQQGDPFRCAACSSRASRCRRRLRDSPRGGRPGTAARAAGRRRQGAGNSRASAARARTARAPRRAPCESPRARVGAWRVAPPRRRSLRRRRADRVVLRGGGARARRAAAVRGAPACGSTSTARSTTETRRGECVLRAWSSRAAGLGGSTGTVRADYHAARLEALARRPVSLACCETAHAHIP